jgi:hypothetical protein
VPLGGSRELRMEGIGQVFEGERFGHGSHPSTGNPTSMDPFWLHRWPGGGALMPPITPNLHTHEQ